MVFITIERNLETWNNTKRSLCFFLARESLARSQRWSTRFEIPLRCSCIIDRYSMTRLDKRLEVRPSGIFTTFQRVTSFPTITERNRSGKLKFPVIKSYRRSRSCVLFTSALDSFLQFGILSVWFAIALSRDFPIIQISSREKSIECDQKFFLPTRFRLLFRFQK